MESLKRRIKELKDLAESVYENEDSIFADCRNVAEHDMREIVDVLLDLDVDKVIAALEAQERLQQFIKDHDNHKFVRCDDWSKDSIIKLLKQFVA